MILTRQQRVALKRVYDREVDNRKACGVGGTYREFRKTVHPGWGCVMVLWAGMWLGIEPDGYTHS